MTTIDKAVFVAAACMIGCGAAPTPTDTRSFHADDGWQRSVTWLHATDGDASGPARECLRVAEVLQNETTCKGRMCSPAEALAREWQDKCGDHASSERQQREAIENLHATLEARLDEPPSACVGDYRTIVEGTCSAPSCQDRAQAWATRCAHTEGSPLALGIVAKTVRRAHGDEAAALDPRSCDELGEALTVGARCADEADCRRATEEVTRYDERCGVPPSGLPLTVALRRYAILAGAGTPPSVEVPVAGATVEGELPLVLANRQGAVLTVCGRRVATDEDYLATRERCGGGPVTFGALRAGKLALVTLEPVGDRSIPEAYPGFALAVEREQAERAHVETFSGALDAALADGGHLARLVQALDRHGHALVRSVGMQRALSERDEQLAPLLATIGPAKVERAKRFGAPLEELRGLWLVGKTRPLADVSPDGTIDPGVETTASLLELETWLPKAVAAYRASLAPLEGVLAKAEDAEAQRRKWSGLDPPEGDPQAIIAANRACLAAREQALGAQRRIESCAFEACDDASLKAAEASLAAARVTATLSRHRYDRATTVSPEAPGPFMCDPLRL